MTVYVGQVALYAFNFAPRGWAPCQGQLMPLSQNIPLFEVLGDTYGGNGQTTFALPDLPGVIVGAGQGPGLSQYDVGQTGGDPAVTLLPNELPRHGHSFVAVTDKATSANPTNGELARPWIAAEKIDNVVSLYSPNPASARTALSPQSIGSTGGGQPHNNMQPYLTLNYCIALTGTMPPRGGSSPPVWSSFMGEIGIFSFGFAPANWVPCAGQLLPIPQNQALYALLGTLYGGDGIRTFALPDLRGRVPTGLGPNSSVGQRGGEEHHALSVSEIPAHSHALMADATTTKTGNQPSSATVLGQSSGESVPDNTPYTANLYSTSGPNAGLNAAAITDAGGGQPHQNMMPSLALNYCINIDRNAPFPMR